MARWLEIPFCIVAFAIPSAIVLLLAWPIMMRRPVPDELNPDAVTILAISVLLGAFIAMLSSVPGQQQARN